MMSKPPALTTTFTPSPSCLSYLYATSGTNNNNQPYVVVNLGPPTDYSTCFPSGWATNSMSYFSPGICPYGYTSACSTLGFLPTITSGETTVICCPSGYTCGTWPPPWVCTSSFIGFPSTTLDLFTTGSKFGGANAFSVQIRFQATDFVSTTNLGPPAVNTLTDTQPPGLSTFSVQIRFQATDFVTTAYLNSPAINTLTDTQPPGLSTGAKAGIGVGVAIGVLTLLLLGALLLWRRRRKAKTDQTPVTNQTPYGVDTKQELDGTSYAIPRVENTSPPVAELEASEAHSDFTSSQPGTRILDPIASDAQFEDAAKLPGLAASSDDAVPETQSTASAPHEVRLREVDEEHDIRQQIKRIRNEKERLARINELERLEAELQERLA
ncbi:hypothetical protein BKA61DRAFT_55400 [Leptodontidium sp. MPI-SDFR-AT-0119]|nr:hypothetical protein BKA61DRAFT_55400 [Leptodontidium sp. MPI-SDFR-AT-0119]